MAIELPPGTADYSDRTPATSNRQILQILGLFVAGLVLAVWLTGILANGLVSLIPVSAERALGELVVPAYEIQADPSPVQQSLNKLLDRLEAHLPPEMTQGRDFQVLYIAEDVVNAVAIPGDHIIIYDGLLGEVESENELMMILGHELGHFAHRDHLRSLGQRLLLRLAIASLIGDAGTLGSIASSSVTAFGNAQFSQAQEKQADEMGLDLLQRTYGHVAGAVDFFERMSQKRGAELAFLATHPTSKSRVQRLQQRIEEKGYREGDRVPLPPALQRVSLSSLVSSDWAIAEQSASSRLRYQG